VNRDSTFNVISSEIPPLPGDHIAASREALAAMPVRTTTMIPETTEAMARPISLLSDGKAWRHHSLAGCVLSDPRRVDGKRSFQLLPTPESACSEHVQSAFRAESPFFPYVQSVQSILRRYGGEWCRASPSSVQSCSQRPERSEHGQFFGHRSERRSGRSEQLDRLVVARAVGYMAGADGV
jgi:hypothetical protein